MDEATWESKLSENPEDNRTRIEFALWLENEGRHEEAFFHKMVAKGLLCDHVWEANAELLLGEEADLEVRPQVYRVILKPGACVQVCRLCKLVRFDMPYVIMRASDPG